MFLTYSSLASLEIWEDVTAVQQEFLRLKRERNWSNVTYNTHRKNLLSYFQALEDADIIERNPIRKVRKCPEPHKDQPKLEMANIGPLFRELSTYRTGISHLLFHRNRLFFLLAYYT